MLRELRVANFAIIENLHIEFQSGLNIISGETGSGKSILLKSLALLMGEKASSESIRSGHPQATVEGLFSIAKRTDILQALEKFGIECSENMLIVKRVVAAADKSKIYLNGSLVSLSQLREIVSPLIEVTGNHAPLIEMTGQHDNRNLLSKSYHLDLLDQFGSTLGLRKSYEKKYVSFSELRERIEKFQTSLGERNQKLDYLKYQLRELQSIDVNPKTDCLLEQEIKDLKHSHKFFIFAEECESLLFGDQSAIIPRLKMIEKKAIDLKNLTPQFQKSISEIETSRVQLEESFFNIDKELKKNKFDSELLEEKETRLSQIRKIQKKYSPDLEEILNLQNKMIAEIAELENSEHILEKLKRELIRDEKDLRGLGEELHLIREQRSKALIKNVNNELLDLNMKGVTFGIQLTKTPTLQLSGITEVEYQCQISEKDPPRSIARVASGGELSRILLALKKSLGEAEAPRTYLFDEVDTGVSGNTAEKVGKKLHSIAKGQQVICVTHLPQVASYGDAHYSIQKSTQNGGVQMAVTELTAQDRVEEIARLISGEKITKTSLAHAQQLLSESLA